MGKVVEGSYAERLTTVTHNLGTVSVSDEIRIGPFAMKVLGS